MELPLAAQRLSRRRMLGGLLAGGFSLLTGCNWDGHFDIFGYTTRPNFDEKYKTVYVPIFRNKAFETTTNRGLEMTLTRALIREIEMTTPMKVVSDPNRADTELLCTLATVTKNLLNRNQENEVREGEVVIGVEVVWRDLRTNQVLSNPRKPSGVLPSGELPPFDPDNPPLREVPDLAVPVLIQYSGRYLTEVGETNLSAQQKACERVARQIVNMMEKDAPRQPVPLRKYGAPGGGAPVPLGPLQ
jgi:hypothetical protein